MNVTAAKRGIFKTFLYLSFLLVVAGVSACLGVGSVVAYQVFWGDDSELQKSTILARINEETTIYTLDETTRIGSFFNENHRTYVPISRVPAHMVRAMVASEDKNFYDHAGVDVFAIASAFWDGVGNGFKFRRGGSSITQQTVKNILDRREHTFQRKFKEMIRALQLERLYSKNEILEFYLNQFHVTANGNGIGIAAKYYFNKSVEDLTLVEAAFIAGSVKAPSKYNPFTKYTKKARETAKKHADDRKNYVIKRMYTQGWIDKDELKQAIVETIPFKKGTFTSKEVALVSLVRGQLNKEEILEALNMDNISELNHAGLKVFTTIDAEMQKKGQLAMKRNLSRLEFILKGFKTEAKERYKPLRRLEKNEFYFGKVAHIQKGPKPNIEIDFGLPVGEIPYESILRTAKLLNMSTYKGEKFHVAEILGKLKVGDVVLSEVKELRKDQQKAVLELRAFPQLNGGLIAVDKGEVRAVVAGFEAKGFNRAMFAVRQPGSVFKSVVYFAALQLGWSILDYVDNERRVFPFQGKFYYPRPDHDSPYSNVSMMWAGIKSENLGSIYLTSHMVDKLNFGQFKELMGHLDLLPHQGESVSEFHYRVARTTGVQLTTAGIRENLLSKAIHDLKPDLIFSGKGKLYRALTKLWWGDGYLPEVKELYAIPDEDIAPKERRLRLEMLKISFERLQALEVAARDDWQKIQSRLLDEGAETLFGDPEMSDVLSRFRVLAGSYNSPSLAYVRTLPEEEEFMEKEIEQPLIVVPPPGRALNPLDVQAIWGASGFLGAQANLSVEDVRLSGLVPLRYVGRIKANLESRFQTVMQRKDTYGLYSYFNHHDFRIVLGLQFLVDLSRKMGVYSALEPVLSFPLGTNVVSVAEVAKIYQTFAEGKTYRFYEKGPDNQLSFIRRIEDRAGNVLYEPKKKEFQLVDECYANQVSEILRKVVTHGTGRRARGELQIPLADEGDKAKIKIRIPAYGKTGTTNDYTTAYFAGFVPYPKVHRAPLSPTDSIIIASYVGYDLNQAMRKGPLRISGAHGALPIWTDFARSVIESENYFDYLDKLNLGLLKSRVWPLAQHKCSREVRVDLPRGTVVSKGDEAVEVFSATNIEREGETYINEFARNSSVKSYVSLAQVGRGSKRIMNLFAKVETDDTKVPLDVTSANDQDVEGGAPGAGEKAPVDPAPHDSDEALKKSIERLKKAMKNENQSNENSVVQKKPKTSNQQTGNSETDEEEDEDGTFSEEELW